MIPYPLPSLPREDAAAEEEADAIGEIAARREMGPGLGRRLRAAGIEVRGGPWGRHCTERERGLCRLLFAARLEVRLPRRTLARRAGVPEWALACSDEIAGRRWDVRELARLVLALLLAAPTGPVRPTDEIV